MHSDSSLRITQTPFSEWCRLDVMYMYNILVLTINVDSTIVCTELQNLPHTICVHVHCTICIIIICTDYYAEVAESYVSGSERISRIRPRTDQPGQPCYIPLTNIVIPHTYMEG